MKKSLIRGAGKWTFLLQILNLHAKTHLKVGSFSPSLLVQVALNPGHAVSMLWLILLSISYVKASEIRVRKKIVVDD